MELQKHKEEQSQEVSDENNISSLLDVCHYSDQLNMKILLHQVSVKKIRMKKNKIIIMEITFTILVIVYFAVEVSFMESKEEILVQNL